MRKLTFTLTAYMILLAIGVVPNVSAQDMPEPPMMTEVADGVYHYWDSGYSSMVVIGTHSVLVTDPSFTPRAERMKDEIDKLTSKKIEYVVLSHEHYDHVGGTEVFENAEVVCHRASKDILSLSPVLPVPEIDITFCRRRTINLGKIKVQLRHIAPGDGVGTTVVRVKSRGVVFSVDMYQPQTFTVSEFKEDTNFVGVRKILNKMLKWDPEYAINGHSPGNSLEALKENAQLFNDLYDAVIEETEKVLDEGGDPFSLIFTLPGELALEGYEDWENFKDGFPAHVRRMVLSIIHGG